MQWSIQGRRRRRRIANRARAAVHLLSSSNNTMLGLNSHQFGLTGPCSHALIGGAQPYMVGGPPSHCAIYIGGGRSALGTRLTSATTPHRYSRSRSERGAASDGKLPPSPATPPDVTASAISISSESMAPANDPNTGASSGSTTPAPNPAPTDGLRFLSLSLSLLFSDRS
jgi:hypothetical protein